MENKRNQRQIALDWWNNEIIESIVNQQLTNKYFNNRYYQTLTGREIEEIWRKETSTSLYRCTVCNEKTFSRTGVCDKCNPDIAYVKPNDKQFKQFSPELFKAYINKFSDEDKLKAIDEIVGSLSDKTKGDYVYKLRSLLSAYR